ncbi:MAG: hypothetical protein NC343_05515 [Muribaculum sp.]|nr:hypothetical protein [Muribaculaceae bacterium]MCM1081189.1 hypothetical protein [Muribaculum sp.]
MAQGKGPQSKPDREEWFKEMRQFKHRFLVKELELTKQQQDEFFPLYDSMQGELEKLQDGIRRSDRKIARAKCDVSDADYLQAARLATEMKSREGAVEEMYFDKFSKVLSAKQMFQLHFAERKFMREVMKQHSMMMESKMKNGSGRHK